MSKLSKIMREVKRMGKHFHKNLYAKSGRTKSEEDYLAYRRENNEAIMRKIKNNVVLGHTKTQFKKDE